jgi:class 3 adenylate cyclase
MCGVALEPAVFDLRLPVPVRKGTNGVSSQVPGLLNPEVGSAQDGETARVPLLSGERRLATVIFADVKGSTELLEQIGTEAWVEVMNNVFQVLEAEIYRFGGEVGQFRGDGLVAFFGTKVANEDDPERAILCAMAMQKALAPVAAELLKNKGNQLTMRVGVNTGEVIVASVGDSKYSEDTAMGEALTIASRMETSAEPGTVLVSDYTHRLVSDLFEWHPIGEIPVKGMSQPMPVYRPIALNKAAEPSQDALACGITHGIIGRNNEQQILRKSVEGLYAGMGGIVCITGVKGMGKSFMANEVRQHFMRQNALMAAVQGREPEQPSLAQDTHIPDKPIQWMSARCRSYGHLRPYSIWLDLIYGWLGSQPEKQAGEVTAVLRAQIDTLWDIDVEKEYPFLATFFSTPTEETATETLRHMDAEGLKRKLFKAVRDWIENLTQQGPLVISFADLQWADSSSLSLLDYCLPLCDTQPVLWLLSYRPDRDSSIWEFEHHLETKYPHRLIHLPMPPLTEGESEEFLDQFLDKQVLLAETRDLIIKKSEGNPYYIKELVCSLISQGALTRDGETGVWKQERSVTSLDLPDSLQSLLMARIDRLPQDTRRVLQMAAAIGSIFWLNTLQALASPSISTKELQNELIVLQREGLIHERTHAEDLGMEYAFDSSLIREVAYESLLINQRTGYHFKIAEYIEDLVYREGKRKYFHFLALHYRLAGDIKKELFYTLQAAQHAQNIYANVEALRYYSRTLELLAEIEKESPQNGAQYYAIQTQKFEALNGRRAVHFLMGNIHEGKEDARALLPLARQMGEDPTWLIDALLEQPGVAVADDSGELERGLPLAAEALDLAVKIGDKRRQMNCLLAITRLKNLINDPAWLETGDKALALSREIHDRQYEAMILLGMGHAYVGRDELEKGMEYLNAALPICQELNDRVVEMTLLRVMGAKYERTGDHFHRLVEYEQKRLKIAREIGNRFEEANTLMFCAQIEALNLGNLEEGLVLVQESLDILEEVSGKIFPLLCKAQIQIALSQFEGAQQALKAASPLAQKNVFELGRVGLKMVTILYYNALGDADSLKHALEISTDISKLGQNELVSRQYLMAAACEAAISYLGLAQFSANEHELVELLQSALDASRTAVEIYNTFGYVKIVECSTEKIYFVHSQALAANHRQAESHEFLEKAYTEMMRVYDFIPRENYYRKTFMENIDIHRKIQSAKKLLGK